MPHIHLLDSQTIDKIAAGEVVERPASVVKELVENSMDAGAFAITVEIRQGGIEFIRVTDNGCGIPREDMERAFLRHATSKISSAEDLNSVLSMGFRGEALASISAVARVEVISKCPDQLLGTRYEVEGGKAGTMDDVGAADGTTILVRNLFYNTPARRKFLKAEKTEGSYVCELMEQLALSRPDISFQVLVNGKNYFSTSGQGNLKESIYRIYGRNFINEIIPIDYEENGIRMEGYLGTPALNRSNRNLENYFINHRFVKSSIISKGIEKGYQEYLMQHKFPFCVIHFSMDTGMLDVNVHPSKKEVRFRDGQLFYDTIAAAVQTTLHGREMIASLTFGQDQTEAEFTMRMPEPFERKRMESRDKMPYSEEIRKKVEDEISLQPMPDASQQTVCEPLKQAGPMEAEETTGEKEPAVFFEDLRRRPEENKGVNESLPTEEIQTENVCEGENGAEEKKQEEKKQEEKKTKPVQMSLFAEERVLSEKSRMQYEIIGQVFDTYWLLTYKDSIYFLDQHAAHEKVNYERLMKRYREGKIVSQQCNPPVILTLTTREQITLENSRDYFEALGFEIEPFGGNEYALREIPLELFSNEPQEMILSVLEELGNSQTSDQVPDAITIRIATQACKASVKGGMKMSRQEIETLLDEMLQLDNPYHCPHGRPTMFSMSRYELEKKFKRVVD